MFRAILTCAAVTLVAAMLAAQTPTSPSPTSRPATAPAATVTFAELVAADPNKTFERVRGTVLIDSITPMNGTASNHMIRATAVWSHDGSKPIVSATNAGKSVRCEVQFMLAGEAATAFKAGVEYNISGRVGTRHAKNGSGKTAPNYSVVLGDVSIAK